MDVRPLRDGEVAALHDDCWLPFALEMQALDAHDALADDLDAVREANVAYRRDRHGDDDTRTVVAVPETTEERRTPEAAAGVDPDDPGLDAPAARGRSDAPPEPAAFAGYAYGEVGESPPVFARGDPLYVNELYVRPEYRGDGLARTLMDAVEDWGRDRGCERAELHVNARNETARAVYERRGYETFMHKLKREL